MPSRTDKFRKFVSDNAFSLIACALIGAYIGGNLASRIGYAEGYTEALKDVVNN